MEDSNPILDETVLGDNDLKEFVVNYVGGIVDPEDGNITVEMIVDIFAEQFPEFLMAVAEENFIRGYNQAFLDIEAHEQAVKDVSDE